MWTSHYLEGRFAVVEGYLRYEDYPNSMEKGDKANLRRKCRSNFKFDSGVLYYKKSNKNDVWLVCVRT